MSFNQRIKDVVGTSNFAKFFNMLSDDDQFKKDIRNAKKEPTARSTHWFKNST